jgi:hydrogenase-4 component E
MIHPVDTILSLALLSILFSFGSSRLPGLIKVMAFQGVVVSIVPLTIGHEMSTGGVIFTIVTLTIRASSFPVASTWPSKK